MFIKKQGTHKPAEGGLKTISFGELFKRYEKINDMLVGILLKGKKRSIIKYRGDMLVEPWQKKTNVEPTDTPKTRGC